MKLMLVEDEYLLNKTIRTYLHTKGYEVDGFLDGMDAVEAISPVYDLYIIDIDIPQINGIEILEHIRSFSPDVPVIMISATIEMQMVTKAYTKGCSDYLKKPFDIKELELKIKAFTRSVDKWIKLSEMLMYDRKAKQLNYEDMIVELTPKENVFLSLLIDNRGRIVSSEQIEVAVWGVENRKPSLRQLVNRLRNKIPEDIIKNRIGEGYIIV